MRVIGSYKEKDIIVKSLYLLETYQGYLLGQRGDFSLNANIIKDKIEEKVHELFGLHKSYCIANLEEIDYNKPLPEEIVHVFLECGAAVKEGNGSYLILVWFQHSTQEPFKLAEDKLKIIDWQRCAQDFKT